ncbi:hypothetical protein D9M68_576230 [compost metagenome]
MRALLAVVVADVVEQAVLVLQLEVVPILAAEKSAAVAVAQLQVMDALENLGEALALLEVQTTVIRSSRGSLATIGHGDEVGVGAPHGPTSADGQLAVEFAFDLAEAEIHCMGTAGGPARNGYGQGQTRNGGRGHLACHQLLQTCYFCWRAATAGRKHQGE